jgi:DNA-binding protein HU-beta
MNKAELVSAIAEKTGQTQSTVGEVLSAFESVVTTAVVGGDKVQIPGFLSFEKSERAARTGRNPATGEEITIGPKPASVTVKARPLAKAKAALPSVAAARRRLAA